MPMSPTGLSLLLRCAFAMQVLDATPPTRFGTACFGTTRFAIMSPFKNSSLKTSIFLALLFSCVVLTRCATLVAQHEGADQHEGAEVPFLYPDPRTVGVQPYVMQPTPAGAVTGNRYAGVPEQERIYRMFWDQYADQEGIPKYEQPPCPLCEEEYKTPCGTCKMCKAGFPCEKTLCRHCLQPRSKNMGNSCDLTAGDEPCGTCDACREHRSDPCEHADNEYGPRGEFNPYRENRLLSVIPRPILDAYNNGARKFPVYYNPAPYYRPTWNPSTFAGYARPYTFRWSCPLCFQDPCGCDRPGMAGQVPYAYTCKFCRRNPCACTMEICDVNKPMDPIGIATALTELREGAGGPQPVEIQDTAPSSPTSPGGLAPSVTTPDDGGTTRLDDLFDDDSPLPEPGQPTRPRPSLDTSPQ